MIAVMIATLCLLAAWSVIGWIALGRRTTLRAFGKNYAYNVHVALSQALNAVLLWGDPDESLSGRIGKAAVAGDRCARLTGWPSGTFPARSSLTRAPTAQCGAKSACRRSEMARGFVVAGSHETPGNHRQGPGAISRPTFVAPPAWRGQDGGNRPNACDKQA
ncbi:MAG: hypothetical protein EAZ99_04090 [Alphaproteobacteria bacterium]|nr:MAG: hypothetical protein EAZ99_04090 [Alphaproteobacteria bacterium]